MTKESNVNGVVIITHTDLDGVVSAAVYINSLNNQDHGVQAGNGVEVHFTEPHNLHSILEDFVKNSKPIKRLVITDLGPNTNTFEQIVNQLTSLHSQGTRIEWYDHHKWNDQWVRVLKERTRAEVHVETDTCAAGVVARHVNLPDEKRGCLKDLVNATCAADIWKWDHPLAPLLYRTTGTPRGVKGDSARRSLLEKMYNCIIWEDSWNEKLEELMDRELQGYKKALKKARSITLGKNIVGVFLLKEKEYPPTSFLASFLMKRYRANVAIIIRSDGAVSLRSTNINVRDLAACLGGGGHPRASGAKILVPLHVRFLRIIVPPLYKRVLMRRVINEVEECIKSKAGW